MSNREHAPERDLDQELRELGAQIEYPATPDRAEQVRRRIEEEAEKGTERRGISWLPALSPKWAAAATLLLFLAVPLFSSGIRDDLSGFLTAGQGAGGSAVQSSGADIASDQSAGSAAQSSGTQSESAVPSSGGDTSTSAGGAAASAEGDFDRKIIKTADLGIRSENVRDSAREAQQIAAQFGGNVLNSQINRGGDVFADLTLSVPSEDFESALEELRGLGEKVTTDAVQGEDVTEEFVDLESRERNLLAAEQGLLELYDDAEDVNDALSIQRELTNVRGEIEQIQGRIQYLEQRSAYSRINLSIAPAEEAATPHTWSPASIVARAWGASLGFLQVVATAFLSVAVFSWWLAPVFILGFVWWRAHNRRPQPDTRDSSPS